MTELSLYNQKNEKVGALGLKEAIFDVPVKRHLLSEIVHWQRASRRSGTACAKTKGEVSGTTKKPFKQKGTGSARQGSLKNPHQIGGGVAFPPIPRSHAYKMPKSKRRLALACALTARLRENNLVLMQDFDLPTPKTAHAFKVLKDMACERALIVDVENENLKKSIGNMQKAKYLDVAGINVYDILKYPKLVLTQKAVLSIEERLLGVDEE